MHKKKRQGALTVGDFGGNLVLVHHRGLNVGFQIKEEKRKGCVMRWRVHEGSDRYTVVRGGT